MLSSFNNIPSIKLKRRDENRNLCAILILDLRQSIHDFTLKSVNCRFFMVSIITFSFPSIARRLTDFINKCWILSNDFFCTYWYDNLTSLIYFINVMNYILIFKYHQVCIHECSPLAMTCFLVFCRADFDLLRFCKGFSSIHEEYWSVLIFFFLKCSYYALV